MSSDRARPDVLETTAHGKVPVRRLGTRAPGLRERECSDERIFRDIHGTEFRRQPNTVLAGHSAGHAAGDDDVHRRHWTVVCADRRSARAR